MNCEDEKQAAQENFERLTAEMPISLSRREERFADQIKRAKINSKKKLDSLYSFMNELYTFARNYTPCKKGCSHCCHYKVTVSEVEIAHIEKHTKKKRNKQFSPIRDFHGSPCPFLKKGACSIYGARPFVCRRHVTLTKTDTWCNPKISNTEKFPLLKFSCVDEAFDYIRQESESFETYDIREVFGKEK